VQPEGLGKLKGKNKYESTALNIKKLLLTSHEMQEDSNTVNVSKLLDVRALLWGHDASTSLTGIYFTTHCKRLMN
jgi:hypothetical protein